MAYTGGPMTEAMYYVLLALTRPNHGYRLMNAILTVSHGRLHMGPGTLYGVLTRMVEDGLLKVLEDDGRRKIYGMTDAGRQALQAEYRRLAAQVADGALLLEEEKADENEPDLSV